MRHARCVPGWVLLVLGAAALCCAQTQPNPPAQPVPVIDGGAGPCAVELTVLADGKPVPAAMVKVHIAYGFGGFHKLDLEAGTDAGGRVRFTGLPSRLHHPPLEFHASKGELVGMATYDPGQECQAKHDILLAPPKAVPDK